MNLAFRVLGPLLLVAGLVLVVGALGSIGGETGILDDPNAHANGTRGPIFLIGAGACALVGGVCLTMLGFRGTDRDQ